MLENKGFISSVVLCEVVWALKRFYRQPKERILLVLKTILETEVFEVEHRDCAWRACYGFDEGDADFSDYYICQVNKVCGAPFTITFHETAQKHRLFRASMQ